MIVCRCKVITVLKMILYNTSNLKIKNKNSVTSWDTAMIVCHPENMYSIFKCYFILFTGAICDLTQENADMLDDSDN